MTQKREGTPEGGLSRLARRGLGSLKTGAGDIMQASKPYLSTAAAAGHEAARFTSNKVQDYVHGKIASGAKTNVPPGEADPAWGAWGGSFVSLSWYERQLVEEESKETLEAEESAALPPGISNPLYADQYQPPEVEEQLREELQQNDQEEGEGIDLEAAENEQFVKWLKKQAEDGDEETQYALAKRFTPPKPFQKEACTVCNEQFGMTRYRHHCRHCGNSFCFEHSGHKHFIHKFGYTRPQRVCLSCKHQLEQEDWRDRQLWRRLRVRAFLAGRLLPYFEQHDSDADKMGRCVDGAIYLAKKAPLGTAAAMTVEVTDVLMKYGLAGVAGLLLRRQFVEAVSVLKSLLGIQESWPLNVHEMTAAMYYMLALKRGARGDNPLAEKEEHKLEGCRAVTQEELLSVREFAWLPLHLLYDRTRVEMQVLCDMHGWSLIYVQEESNVNQPSFALLAHPGSRTAAVVIRGTSSIHDVITDIQHIPVTFPPEPTKDDESGWTRVADRGSLACCGMARAAAWLHREVEAQLIALQANGYTVRVLGHSLGAGVGALLGYLLHTKGTIKDIKVIGFAPPACMDETLAAACDDFVTSVVLHDDIIPRITAASSQTFLKDLLSQKEGWAAHLDTDWDAVVQRAKGFWAPRWRTNTVRSREGKEECQKEDTNEAFSSKVGKFVDGTSSSLKKKIIALPEGQEKGGLDGHDTSEKDEDSSQPKPQEAPMGNPSEQGLPTAGAWEEEELGVEDASSLPQMYIPGQIIHMYANRGTYQASFIPRTHPSLGRIEVFGNCVNDHKANNYFEGILECLDVQKARAMGYEPPQWVPFSASETCQACGSDFTWASTSRSAAQQQRDKHNCRACGGLVCGPCSANARAVPAIGLSEPSRVCDRCFYRGLSIF
ncbi:unnamed protein product [Chrysoparadoxa australica]